MRLIRVGQTISGGNRKCDVSRHTRTGLRNKTGSTVTQEKHKADENAEGSAENLNFYTGSKPRMK